MNITALIGVIILIMVTIMLLRYYFSDLHQNKSIKLIYNGIFIDHGIDPIRHNKHHKHYYYRPPHKNSTLKIRMKTDKRFENNRALTYKHQILKNMADDFTKLRKDLDAEKDIKKKMELYREYEKECLKRWKSYDIDIEALPDNLAEQDMEKIEMMKELNSTFSKSRIQQNILTFTVNVPLGWFYHWDLVPY